MNGSGTHKGDLHSVQLTDKKSKRQIADLYRIENGIITGHWDVDSIALVQYHIHNDLRSSEASDYNRITN